MHAKRQSLVIRNVGSWDSGSTQQVTGQTVAAQIRRRVAIFVEPSPFSHVSGMKNRFECLIQGLRGTIFACGQPAGLLNLSLTARAALSQSSATTSQL